MTICGKKSWKTNKFFENGYWHWVFSMIKYCWTKDNCVCPKAYSACIVRLLGFFTSPFFPFSKRTMFLCGQNIGRNKSSRLRTKCICLQSLVAKGRKSTVKKTFALSLKETMQQKQRGCWSVFVENGKSCSLFSNGNVYKFLKQAKLHKHKT